MLAGVFAALAALASCSGAGLLNAITSRAGYTLTRDHAYGEGERARYDLYLPAEAGPSTPVVVFVHGGSWDTGSKDLYRFVGQSLASRGYAVAIPNYRLYPHVTFPAFVDDAARATAAVAKAAAAGREGFAAGRHPLFLMGHSAGAEIAGLLATDDHYLREAGLRAHALAGFIGLAGPYDFLPLTDERYKKIFPPATRAASQPVNFVDGGEPPMLLIAGDADTTVDPRNSRSLAEKVTRAGGSVELVIVPGVDHVGAITSLATALPLGARSIRDRVLAFLKEHA
ncbi:alpha/beta hydrolase [Aurantimonas sp. MSK8Z-1]|uniref:alpha/beta hydrolase n=1 Tax=Mangrovibrevibacter kandeliae TaxID=2968473 RepID=UPI0021175697|nr:alpha/beta hydrolase [Aurantimonas sp. MSK8Z-1]MCW4115327.1 alpha/beta hydrolase [Aurantimonas sp. MSK8Z-1]